MINSIIPIYCDQCFVVGSLQTVFYDNQLMNCEILEAHYSKYNQWYKVKVIEFPAKKRI
jgi:hypothetical protein